MTGLGLAAQVCPEKSLRFAREKYFPADWKLCTEQFLSLFHRYGYIYRSLSGGSWYSAEERWKLTDSEILKAIAGVHPRYFLGCRSGRATRFAVIDIDAGSKYHTSQQLRKILAVLSSAALSRTSLFRSSYSGGWHLYIFFAEPISSSDLRRQLVSLLELNGFEIAKGTLEIFPHRGDASLGQGLRLPLQPGWAWLSKETLEVELERSELSATKALELFVDALDGDSHSYADFRKLKEYVLSLEQRKANLELLCGRTETGNVIPLRLSESAGEFTSFVKAIFRQLPPGMNADTWYKGRLFHLNGLSGPSQRAEAIFCLSHYLFYGDPSRELPALGYGYEEERRWAIEHYLESRHNGQSRDINAGKADATNQADRVANWRPRHKKDVEQKYTTKRSISWVKENANRQTDARKRIKSALEVVKSGRRPFTTTELQEKAGCSRTTLYKHQDLWRKDYEDLADGFFESCTHEYNAVEGAASAESTPLPSVIEKIAPPGLLAARRIAYEISLRSQKDRVKKEKSAFGEKEAAEKQWRDRVASLTEKRPSELTRERSKTLLTVLASYLMVAPCEETAQMLQAYIRDLREDLKLRMSQTLKLSVVENGIDSSS